MLWTLILGMVQKALKKTQKQKRFRLLNWKPHFDVALQYIPTIQQINTVYTLMNTYLGILYSSSANRSPYILHTGPLMQVSILSGEVLLSL